MSEADPTGYGESADTTDGPVTPGHEQVAGDDGEATLTTDAEAQREDSVTRPGNQSD